MNKYNQILYYVELKSGNICFVLIFLSVLNMILAKSLTINLHFANNTFTMTVCLGYFLYVCVSCQPAFSVT